MEEYDFQFYPTLLNEYHWYLTKPCSETKQKLLNKINRIPETDPAVLTKFRKGISFESAVLKNKAGGFDKELINEAATLLPQKRKTQVLLSFQHKNIKFYGYADVVGESRVIDLKSTANHKPGRHDLNYQNLYLYALQNAGFKSMEYIICDFEKIYVERYHLSEYDFDSMLKEMEGFRSFLTDNLELIRDKKILKKRELGLFKHDF
jgi:hypothetical protein